MIDNFKIQQVLSDLWDLQKKLTECENHKKMSENHKIHVEERGATHILFYSICVVVPVFITGIRNHEIECIFSLCRFRLEKVHFSRCFIQNGKKSSP